DGHKFSELAAIWMRPSAMIMQRFMAEVMVRAKLKGNTDHKNDFRELAEDIFAKIKALTKFGKEREGLELGDERIDLELHDLDIAKDLNQLRADLRQMVNQSFFVDGDPDGDLLPDIERALADPTLGAFKPLLADLDQRFSAAIDYYVADHDVAIDRERLKADLSFGNVFDSLLVDTMNKVLSDDTLNGRETWTMQKKVRVARRHAFDKVFSVLAEQHIGSYVSGLIKEAFEDPRIDLNPCEPYRGKHAFVFGAPAAGKMNFVQAVQSRFLDNAGAKAEDTLYSGGQLIRDTLAYIYGQVQDRDDPFRENYNQFFATFGRIFRHGLLERVFEKAAREENINRPQVHDIRYPRWGSSNPGGYQRFSQRGEGLDIFFVDVPPEEHFARALDRALKTSRQVDYMTIAFILKDIARNRIFDTIEKFKGQDVSVMFFDNDVQDEDGNPDFQPVPFAYIDLKSMELNIIGSPQRFFEALKKGEMLPQITDADLKRGGTSHVFKPPFPSDEEFEEARATNPEITWQQLFHQKLNSEVLYPEPIEIDGQSYDLNTQDGLNAWGAKQLDKFLDMGLTINFMDSGPETSYDPYRATTYASVLGTQRELVARNTQTQSEHLPGLAEVIDQFVASRDDEIRLLPYALEKTADIPVRIGQNTAMPVRWRNQAPRPQYI
ncbi:MAG: hypothetical protein AAF569_02500, partial [Pseudomonadota bacterium]